MQRSSRRSSRKTERVSTPSVPAEERQLVVNDTSKLPDEGIAIQLFQTMGIERDDAVVSKRRPVAEVASFRGFD